MKIMDWKHVQNALHAAVWCLAAVFWLSTGAEAAKISIKNCQAKTVKICVIDKDPVLGGTSVKDSKFLKQGDRIHSRCGSACRLEMAECSSSCECRTQTVEVTGKFGRGTYALTSLSKSSSKPNKYANADFEQILDDPTDNDMPIDCP